MTKVSQISDSFRNMDISAANMEISAANMEISAANMEISAAYLTADDINRLDPFR